MDLMNLRVVALGHSGAGRSSCLAGMSTHLAADRKGFRPVTADRRTADDLTTAGGRLRQGVHPPPSSRRTELKAGLRYGRGEVPGFHWTAYRGGALTGSAADGPETARLPVSWFKGVEGAAQRLKYGEGRVRELKEEVAGLSRPARKLARLLEREQRGTAPPVGAPVRAVRR
ncbi:hypothetical protein [Kitasatospora sp. NPDC056184]|uniref:hypothetical protein n=1 Tax=Kitasatospora sp. NPDC056184 TaxID=3345738 RepID=UPI0035D74314